MARLFSPEWLDELKSRCDIVDIVSRYVPLKRNGREWTGSCPFHHEKTPSFFVYPDSQNYHCFGCKASGDVIQFISKYENLGFTESVQRLADMANMPLPEMKDTDAEEISRKKNERAQILACLKEAARYYYKNLYSDHNQASIARAYLEKRQISRESIVRFGIGVSLDFESLIPYLKGKGYYVEILKKAGLVGETDGRMFDAYGKRLVFPLINKDSDVIGFSARLLENRDDRAKYKNTTATPVFNKSEVVFGINLLKKLRDQNRGSGAEYVGLENIIIVEGQIDVITMHQFGFTNTVAGLGTALTPMHARRLKQFSENIILLLDGDEAGRKATLRSIDVLRSQALNVRVASLPAGKDPDEFLHTYGAEELKKILNNATEGIKYKIDILAQQYDLTEPNARAKFVHESLVVLKGLSSEAEREAYLPIVHSYSTIPVDKLRIDLNEIDEKAKPYYEREDDFNTPISPPETVKKDGYTLADLYILASILYSKPYIAEVDTTGLHFIDNGLKQAYDYIVLAREHGNTPNISGLYSYMEVDKSTPLLREVVSYEFLPDPFPALTLKSCVLKNKERTVRIERDRAQAECSVSHDREVRDDKMKEALVLTKQLEEIRKDIDKVNLDYSAKRTAVHKRKSKED